MESTIRLATEADIPQIADIHRMAFGHAFLSRMGVTFLRMYYGLVHEFRGGILVVHSQGTTVDGFVAGFVQPEEFYRTMRRRSARFAGPTLAAVLRDPTLVGRIIYNARRINVSMESRSSMGCELSSIAVKPGETGHGVGKRLVAAFLNQAWARDAQYVYLTTDAQHNDSANEFYAKLGFHLRQTFEQFRGRQMNEYVIHRHIAALSRS